MSKIIDFLVFTNLFVALAVTALIVEPALLFGQALISPVTFFLFTSTLSLYSFHRWYRLAQRTEAEQQEARHQWLLQNKVIFLSVFTLSSICWLYTLLQLRLNTIIHLLPVLVIALAYTVPVLNGKRLRDIPLLKIFLITAVVTYVSTVIPMVEWGVTASQHKGLIFRRALFIFAITLPFDIRDLAYDREHRVSTIPVQWGVTRSIQLSLLGIVLFLSLLFYAYVNGGMDAMHALALGISGGISSIVIFLSKEKRSPYYYPFLLEGMMLLQGILLYVFW